LVGNFESLLGFISQGIESDQLQITLYFTIIECDYYFY